MNKNSTNSFWSRTLLGSVLVAGAISAQADATNRWESSVSAGLSLTRGNSDTLLANVDFQTERRWQHDELRFKAGMAYGENNDVKNTDNTSASAQYNHIFQESLYGGVKLDYLRDEITDLDYRLTLSPLIGYYAIKNPTTRLSFEAGPSLIMEEQAGEKDEYIGLRIGERFEHKFSDKAKVFQSIEFVPDVRNFSNFLIVGEVGVETALTQSFSLRAVLQDVYDNEPANKGLDKNDLKLITSLVYKF